MWRETNGHCKSTMIGKWIWNDLKMDSTNGCFLGNSWKLIKILISWSLAKRKRKWRFPDGLEFAPSNIEQKHAAADRELFGAPGCWRVLLYLVHSNFARHHGFCSLCMLLARVCRWTATSQIAVFICAERSIKQRCFRCFKCSWQTETAQIASRKEWLTMHQEPQCYPKRVSFNFGFWPCDNGKATRSIGLGQPSFIHIKNWIVWCFNLIAWRHNGLWNKML